MMKLQKLKILKRFSVLCCELVDALMIYIFDRNFALYSRIFHLLVYDSSQHNGWLWKTETLSRIAAEEAIMSWT